MITAVDTNVLLDVFGADNEFGPRSAAALRTASQEGRVVACEIVWAETVGALPTPALARDLTSRLGLEYDPAAEAAATAAGAAWHAYRARGGSRTRLVADFLVGAHALTQADRLLTRDRGFYRTYFDELEVTDPTDV